MKDKFDVLEYVNSRIKSMEDLIKMYECKLEELKCIAYKVNALKRKDGPVTCKVDSSDD